MIKNYFNTNIYVMNDNKLVYKLYSTETHDTSMYITLELVCGWDYINPDYNNIQGWVKPDRFIDDVQSEYLVCYLLEESIKECLEESGFTFIKNNPLNGGGIND